MKLLFVLKKRENSIGSGLSSGLINSVKLIKPMLDSNKIVSDIVEVIDNNCIDREVTLHKPTHVIVEAIWVVPSKFIELKRLHPTVKWIVRIHSEIPFLAGEGNAINWINEYLRLGIDIAVNSPRIYNDMLQYVDIKYKSNIILLPNYYKVSSDICHIKTKSDYLNIGCFGAIRPLKNQLIQAMASIVYAKKYNTKINFHINVSRLENDGSNNVLKNIRAIFENLGPNINLVEHGWYEHTQFLKVIKNFDLGLQVSLSETFNIVTADFVSLGIPVVVSEEITWVSDRYRANATDVTDIVKRMHLALTNKKCAKDNISKLTEYDLASEAHWLHYLLNKSLPTFKKSFNLKFSFKF